jgi:ribosomal protein S18 acetylase RimI-like enzyme
MEKKFFVRDPSHNWKAGDLLENHQIETTVGRHRHTIVMYEPIANLVFQHAKLTDLKRLVQLIKRYYVFDHIAFNAKDIRSGLKTMIRDKSNGQAFLITVNEKPIGYTILTYCFDLEFGGRTALMTDLYLEPKYRRLGIGRETLQFLEQFCRARRLNALELQVERTNTAARAFYRRLSFEAHDRIPMTKRLDPRASFRLRKPNSPRQDA